MLVMRLSIRSWVSEWKRAATTAFSLEAEKDSDKAASIGVDVRHGGAATTVTRLDAGQGSGNINKTSSMPHDSPLPRGHTLGSNEGRMQQHELMDLVTKLSDRCEALEIDLRQTKKVYGDDFTRLIKKVKKLEQTIKTSQARRRSRVVISDDAEEDLEDSSKHRRMIEEIHQNARVTLVAPTDSQEDQPEDQLGVFSAAKEIYSEDTRRYWRIIRVRNHTEAYQTFDDMLNKFDRDNLDKIWSLVKERFSSIDPTDDKERTLWVELKREVNLYYRGYDIFMLVEKDYQLTKGLLTLMLCNKLQVDQYSEMADELLRKIGILANKPRQGGLLGIKGFYKFLLLVQLSTAKRRLSTAKLKSASIRRVQGIGYGVLGVSWSRDHRNGVRRFDAKFLGGGIGCGSCVEVRGSISREVRYDAMASRGINIDQYSGIHRFDIRLAGLNTIDRLLDVVLKAIGSVYVQGGLFIGAHTTRDISASELLAVTLHTSTDLGCATDVVGMRQRSKRSKIVLKSTRCDATEEVITQYRELENLPYTDNSGLLGVSDKGVYDYSSSKLFVDELRRSVEDEVRSVESARDSGFRGDARRADDLSEWRYECISTEHFGHKGTHNGSAEWLLNTGTIRLPTKFVKKQRTLEVYYMEALGNTFTLERRDWECRNSGLNLGWRMTVEIGVWGDEESQVSGGRSSVFYFAPLNNIRRENQVFGVESTSVERSVRDGAESSNRGVVALIWEVLVDGEMAIEIASGLRHASGVSMSIICLSVLDVIYSEGTRDTVAPRVGGEKGKSEEMYELSIKRQRTEITGWDAEAGALWRAYGRLCIGQLVPEMRGAGSAGLFMVTMWVCDCLRLCGDHNDSAKEIQIDVWCVMGDIALGYRGRSALALSLYLVCSRNAMSGGTARHIETDINLGCYSSRYGTRHLLE
ncbi:hypothetical protein Tco_0150136 [Tanacetum coccineum]